jgi:hypothetical protein
MDPVVDTADRVDPVKREEPKVTSLKEEVAEEDEVGK